MNKDIHRLARGRDNTGFRAAMHLYGRILGVLLAVIGLCSLIALQAGWFGLRWPSEIPLDVNELAAGDRTDRATIEVTGPKNLFSRGMTVVDTARTYRLDADVRVLPGEDGTVRSSAVYFGVSTYDENGDELKSGPGTYRYAGAHRRIIASDQGWVHIGGTITGEGDVSYKQFRPRTRFIKLVLLANYRSSDEPVMLIRNVTFTELVALAP